MPLTHPKFPFAIPFEHAPATQAIHTWKSLNKNDGDQVLCARETEHPTQTLHCTKTAGRHNLVEVIVISGFPSHIDLFTPLLSYQSGRTATLHSSSQGPIGSEYMCIPDRIEYPKHENMSSGLYLSPVKYAANLDIFTVFLESQCQLLGAEKCKNLKLKHPHLFKRLDYFQIPCAVCLRDRRTVTIVTPGRDTCQSGSWQKEYAGFLMTQEGVAAGSKLICVNADAQGVDKSNTTSSQGPFLQPVAYKCLGASCTESHNKPMALPCVVCSI